MADDDINDTDDEHDGSDHGHSSPAADPVLIALELCRLAGNKTTAAALKKLRRLDRQYADIEAKIVALDAQAEQRDAALTARAAELDVREAALDARSAAFANELTDARDELHRYHNSLVETHRQLVHRILATTGLLGAWNWTLQSPPTWEQLRRMVADLPADLPAAPPAEIVSQEVRTDWAGSEFMPGSTVTRTIGGAA
jgi:hypothetical protein